MRERAAAARAEVMWRRWLTTAFPAGSQSRGGLACPCPSGTSLNPMVWEWTHHAPDDSVSFHAPDLRGVSRLLETPAALGAGAPLRKGEVADSTDHGARRSTLGSRVSATVERHLSEKKCRSRALSEVSGLSRKRASPTPRRPCSTPGACRRRRAAYEGGRRYWRAHAGGGLQGRWRRSVALRLCTIRLLRSVRNRHQGLDIQAGHMPALTERPLRNASGGSTDPAVSPSRIGRERRLLGRTLRGS